MRTSVLLAALVLGQSAPALAQDTPKVDISGAFSSLGDHTFEQQYQQPEKASYPGWVGSVANHFNPWLAIMVELGGNYRAGYQVRGESVNLQIHSYLAGPRLSVRAAEKVTPFFSVLVGATRFMAHVAGPNESSVELAVQPGGGVDIWLGERGGIRVGGDYRHVMAEDARGEFRVQAGVVFRIGRR